MKRAFTIVELLAAVTILSILLSIVFVSVQGALSGAREKHAAALCQTVQAGLAAYYAQFGRWPGPVAEGKDRASNGGESGEDDPLTYVLTVEETRKTVLELVNEVKNGNPLMDISGLYVSRKSGEGGRAYGLDFVSAIRGTRRSRQKMRTSEMYFGYPDPGSGRFRSFKMTYSIPTDSIRVEQR